MGWNLARYGALLAGEVVSQDFWAFAVTMLLVVGVYGVALLSLGSLDYNWLRRGIPILLLVATTHVLADTRGRWLDRLLYGPAAGGLRWQLRSLATRVGRQPDLLAALTEVRDSVDSMVRGVEVPHASGANGVHPDGSSAASARADVAPPADFRLLIEGALRHLNDLPTLSRHDLLDELLAGEPGTPLERAGRLRGLLEEAIGRLAPPGPRPSTGAQAGQSGWLHFLVLHEAYVEGRPNKQIMQRYQLSEGTFHRARRRAVDAIAVDLYQRQAGGVPALGR
jgi:hypothetical protein